MSVELKKGFGHGGVFARTLPDHAAIESLIPDSVSDSHEKWMALALLEAMNGIGWASPNPAVGCIVAKNEGVLARGFTQAYGGLHAERAAFKSLQENHDLNSCSGLTVYVTLEPCTHQGKQPPCVDLLFHPAVETVVIAIEDPDPRVSGRGIQKLKDAGKNVILGVLKNEAAAWHFPFLYARVKKRPLWVAKWAQNQNGLLSDAEGNSKWITNESSRAHTHWLRQKYDAILVGAGTWLKDRPLLTARDCARPHHRNPVILIHDPKNRLGAEPKAQAIHVFKQETMLEFIKAVEETDFGFELQSIFCEGGARTLNELFRTGRIELIHRFTGQKDFGVSTPGTAHRITEFQENDPLWRCATTTTFGNDLLQEWVKWF